MIFQISATPSVRSTLTNNQIWQKIAKYEEKPCSTCLLNLFLRGTAYTMAIGFRYCGRAHHYVESLHFLFETVRIIFLDEIGNLYLNFLFIDEQPAELQDGLTGKSQKLLLDFSWICLAMSGILTFNHITSHQYYLW